VSAAPEYMEAAASDLANLASTISEAHTAAAASTTAIAPAAADEVSAAIAALFGSHAQQFQALSAKAAAFHDQFAQTLTGGAGAYVKAEAANVLGLMVGDHAAASAAATSALFIDPGDIGDKADKFIGLFEPLIEAERKIAVAKQLAEQANRVQQITTNGLKLLGKDGAVLYTDGRELVAIGGRYPYLFPYTQDFIIARKFITDAWGISQQTLSGLFGSEIHVLARGDGLAQTYFQKVGNHIYLVNTDAQGQITQRFNTTETSIAQAVQGVERVVGPAEQEARQTILEAGDAFRERQLQQLLTNPTASQLQEVVGLQLDGSVAAVDSLVGRGEPAARLVVEAIERNVAALIREEAE
jgi:PE family